MDKQKLAEQDAAILKGAFTKDDPRLYTLRSLLLGFPVSVQDKTILQQLLGDSNLRGAIKRKLYPEFSVNAPLGSLGDVWGGVEQQIMGKDRDTIKQVVGYKYRTIDLFKAAMSLLEDPFQSAPNLNDFPSIDVDPLQEWVVARNMYIGTVDKTMAMINAIVNVPVVDEKAQDLNSSR